MVTSFTPATTPVKTIDDISFHPSAKARRDTIHDDVNKFLLCAFREKVPWPIIECKNKFQRSHGILLSRDYSFLACNMLKSSIGFLGGCKLNFRKTIE